MIKNSKCKDCDTIFQYNHKKKNINICPGCMIIRKFKADIERQRIYQTDPEIANDVKIFLEIRQRITNKTGVDLIRNNNYQNFELAKRKNEENNIDIFDDNSIAYVGTTFGNMDTVFLDIKNINVQYGIEIKESSIVIDKITTPVGYKDAGKKYWDEHPLCKEISLCKIDKNTNINFKTIPLTKKRSAFIKKRVDEYRIDKPSYEGCSISIKQLIESDNND